MKDYQFIAEILGCEYELFESTQTGDIIETRFNELLIKGRMQGFYPLIIVVTDILREALELNFEDIEELEPTAENAKVLRSRIIGKAADTDYQDVLKRHQPEYNDELIGKFFNAEPSNYLFSYITNIDIPYPCVMIAKIPAKNPWELPAWIPMGGFNDCPQPHEQIAVFKHWYEKYGAVPVAVTYDEWEMLVAKPPVSDDECENAAKEHFEFCSDIVLQQTGDRASIRGRGSIIRNAKAWYFWWD